MASRTSAARPGSLATYRKKRDFAQTPEPSGRKATRKGSLHFVVQMHRATRLHYDFRLEADGVLASWAVPKGPTLAPGDRRLAMHVEDHPMDYKDFEGNIPEKQYGAGNVIVWDRGTYTLAEGDDPADEIAKGKIKFVLHGKKLRGEFTLVKIKPRESEHGEPWLLIKDRDEYADPSYDPADHPKSVKSGKTLKDVAADPRARTWQSKPSARHATAPRTRARVRRDPIPHPKSLMLATLVAEPFDDPAWLFEIKWDGYRALCTIEQDKFSLVSRNGLDMLRRFPDLKELAGAFASVPVVVVSPDGTLVPKWFAILELAWPKKGSWAVIDQVGSDLPRGLIGVAGRRHRVRAEDGVKFDAEAGTERCSDPVEVDAKPGAKPVRVVLTHRCEGNR